MDALLRDDLSGPHLMVRLQDKDQTIILLGEDHSNANQCWQSGKDIVNLIVQCAHSADVSVYIEMSTALEQLSAVDTSALTCSARPASGPRQEVLNEMRVCLLRLRQGGSDAVKSRVHFIDPREQYGHLPFTEEEDAFVIAAARHPAGNRTALQDWFLNPLQAASADLPPRLHAAARALWQQKVELPAAVLACAVHRNAAHAAVRIYRTATDQLLHLLTLSKILRAMEQGHSQHVVYTGSAHTEALRLLLLQQLPGLDATEWRSPTTVGCVLKNIRNQQRTGQSEG